MDVFTKNCESMPKRGGQYSKTWLTASVHSWVPTMFKVLFVSQHTGSAATRSQCSEAGDICPICQGDYRDPRALLCQVEPDFFFVFASAVCSFGIKLMCQMHSVFLEHDILLPFCFAAHILWRMHRSVVQPREELPSLPHCDHWEGLQMAGWSYVLTPADLLMWQI